MGPLPWSRTDRGVRLRLRLTPRGGRNAVTGVLSDAGGAPLIGVKVAAAPVDGGANAALVALLARHLPVPKSAISIVAGQTARLKTIEIAGDPDALECALRALAAGK